MKKIIATVLAMVMALALCTTAFAAADKYDLYLADSNNSIRQARPPRRLLRPDEYRSDRYCCCQLHVVLAIWSTVPDR